MSEKKTFVYLHSVLTNHKIINLQQIYLKIPCHEQKNVPTIKKKKKKQTRIYGQNGFCKRTKSSSKTSCKRASQIDRFQRTTSQKIMISNFHIQTVTVNSSGFFYSQFLNNLGVTLPEKGSVGLLLQSFVFSKKEKTKGFPRQSLTQNYYC